MCVFTAKLTLDPEIAHLRTVLSADRCPSLTVPFWIQQDTQAADINGRCSVAKKSCYHIGMASESAPRKGSLVFHPVTSFWTITLNKQGELRALNEIPVTIQAETHLLTLGVLLDYKKGQISFYDAGTRSHMYTCSGQTFTDRIYPFINNCSECWKSSPISFGSTWINGLDQVRQFHLITFVSVMNISVKNISRKVNDFALCCLFMITDSEK